MVGLRAFRDGSEVESHDGTAGVRATDLTEARGDEEPHRAGEQRRAAHPFGLEGIRVDRMTLN